MFQQLDTCGRCDRLTGLPEYPDHLGLITLTNRLLQFKELERVGIDNVSYWDQRHLVPSLKDLPYSILHPLTGPTAAPHLLD